MTMPTPERTLLRIDSSARTHGSHSRALADHFQARWVEAYPDGRVISRSLTATPVPHLDDDVIAALQGRPDAPPSELSDQLIAELVDADDLLISSPLYNFTLPSPLKAWFDHIVRLGHTVAADPETGYRGLLTGKAAYVITTRGTTSSPNVSDDFQTPCIRAILSFIGVSTVSFLPPEGTGEPGPQREQRLAAVRAQIDELLPPPPEPAWLGTFTEQDRHDLGALRAGQAAAIRAGDAAAYARLCADDIRLMIPNHDIVCGREQFLACEEALFRNARFHDFRKFPERVECSGDLAVETGRQTAITSQTGDAAGVFSARQKYTHVFRRTSQGWRFAVLMSSSNG